MTIKLKDRSMASMRMVNGRCKLTFHRLDRVMVLPVGTEVTVTLIEKLYKALKA